METVIHLPTRIVTVMASFRWSSTFQIYDVDSGLCGNRNNLLVLVGGG